MTEQRIHFQKGHSNFLKNASTPETAHSRRADTPTPNSIQSPQDGIKRKQKDQNQMRNNSKETVEVLSPQEELQKCLLRQSSDRFRTVTMALSKIFKRDQEKLKAFKVILPHLDEKGFELELVLHLRCRILIETSR